MPRKISKTLIPNDFGDILSLVSIFGFIAIFFKYSLDSMFLTENTTSVFLILGGAGLMIVGRVFTVREWVRDGIQPNEFSQLFAIVFGLSSFVVGILLLFGVNLPVQIQGWIGLFALPPIVFIAVDYYIMNMRGASY